MDAALVLQGNACNDDYILQDVSLSLSLSYTLLASPFFITFQRLFSAVTRNVGFFGFEE